MCVYPFSLKGGINPFFWDQFVSVPQEEEFEVFSAEKKSATTSSLTVGWVPALEKKTTPTSSLTVGWVPSLTPPTECRTSEEVNFSWTSLGFFTLQVCGFL